MILGFNHNVMYKGEVFHVQTEDSGVKQPNITTLLYKGGVILCSKKTSYADILTMENLEDVVEELMKEQHKELMRRLRSGEFDERAFALPASTFENYRISGPEEKVTESADAAAESGAAAVAFSRDELSRALKQLSGKDSPRSDGADIPQDVESHRRNLDEELDRFFDSLK